MCERKKKSGFWTDQGPRHGAKGFQFEEGFDRDGLHVHGFEILIFVKKNYVLILLNALVIYFINL